MDGLWLGDKILRLVRDKKEKIRHEEWQEKMGSFNLGHLNALLNQAIDDLNLYLDHLNVLNQEIEWSYLHVLGKTQNQNYQRL